MGAFVYEATDKKRTGRALCSPGRYLQVSKQCLYNFVGNYVPGS